MPLDAAGKHRTSRLLAWFFGLLALGSLILLAGHIGEVEQFVHLMRNAEPRWLIASVSLQLLTYLCVALVWYLALRGGDVRPSLPSLVSLAIAKLFTDQAMPSGGISGSVFFVTALRRQGIASRRCAATLLLNIVSYYAAYLIALLSALGSLYAHQGVTPWAVAITVLFCLLIALLAVGFRSIAQIRQGSLPTLLKRFPGLSNFIVSLRDAPRDLIRNHSLFSAAVLLQAAVFFLDSATLWVTLRVVALDVPFSATLASFVFASIVATLTPIPLGLGTFEATCTGMLGLVGVPIEAALTATLLMRGFTLWLPMLPGLWLAKRALGGTANHETPPIA